MKANGYYEVSDVPSLLKRRGMVAFIAARGALIEAAEQVVNDCERAGRAMKPAEQLNVEEYMARVRDISTDLAAFKRDCIAGTDCGLPVILPF